MSRLREYRIRDLQQTESAVNSDGELELDISGKSGDENVFDESLHNLLPEDIELKKNAHGKKKKSGGAVARRIILIFCCAVFVGCAVYLSWNLIDKQRGKALYDDVAQEMGDIFGETDENDGAVSRLSSLMGAQGILCLKDRLAAGDSYNTIYNSDSRIDEMRAKLTSLAEGFPDLYGWISIEGTAINYPVVQGEDNDYYLNASPYKKPLINGSIFVDYRNNEEIMTNFNTVLYGHNLTGGGMFHDVQTFFENEELFMNTLIYIYTLDGAYVYEPFAVYSTKANYQYFRTEFATTDEFVAFANEMQSNSVYQKNIEFTPTDRIITMSTCTNRSSDGRYALHAKLVQVIH